MKFRVLQGKHFEGGTKETGPLRVYYRGGPNGDIVESNRDLCEVYNREGSIKFERVSEDAVPTMPEAVEDPKDTLSSMTVAELRKLAQEEEIDLGNLRSKEEILAVIRKATAAVS